MCKGKKKSVVSDSKEFEKHNALFVEDDTLKKLQSLCKKLINNLQKNKESFDEDPEKCSTVMNKIANTLKTIDAIQSNQQREKEKFFARLSKVRYIALKKGASEEFNTFLNLLIYDESVDYSDFAKVKKVLEENQITEEEVIFWKPRVAEITIEEIEMQKEKRKNLVESINFIKEVE